MEKRFEGMGVSPGIAVGPAHVREAGTLEVPERRVPKKGLAAEEKRLTAAVILARRQIKRLKAQAEKDAVTQEMHFLFDAYLQMLEDSRLVRGAQDLIRAKGLNAEAAVQKTL
ncbi:MAG: phosphoenolpyruvate-utilizing N-terminal domain-containing protein, partial [Rhodospirillales bacterium]